MFHNDQIEIIANPEDTLRKRQILYTGEELHMFHHFPGIYDSTVANELPTLTNSQLKTDGTYLSCLNREKIVVNPEDESSRVGEDELLKSYRYNETLRHAFRGMNVHSAITTPLPLSKCMTSIGITKNINFAPEIISYVDNYDGEKILSTIREKILIHENVLSNVEAMNLVMLPRMFTKDQDIVLEEVCMLLEKARIVDEDYKNELKIQMECMIHKYAKSDEDIKRLTEVIGLKAALRNSQNVSNIDLQILCNSMIATGHEKGFNEGLDEGNLLLALKIIKEFGIDVAERLSGIPRCVLEEHIDDNR